MNGFLTNMGDELSMEHWSRPSVMRHTHTHPQYELYFCPQKVAQTSVINGVSYQYSYPCVILSPPFTVHSMSCDDPQARQYERFVFYFGSSLIHELKSHLPCELLPSDMGLLFALTEAQGAQLKRILDLYDSQSSSAQRELTFALFLHQMVRFCPMETVVRVGTPSFYLRDVLRYIAKEFQTISNSEDVARQFAVSRSKLDRDFKRFTGMTVHGFVEICRLNQAKYLLQFHEKIPIGEIAERCGFGGETYFFPFFKKHTGMTPMEFRNQVNMGREPLKDTRAYRSICGEE